jgi:molybdate transport system substrate-binding protein
LILKGKRMKLKLPTLLYAMLLLAAQCSRADEILVSAASSLTDALNEVGMAYTHLHPRTTVRFNFAASGVLQQQILQGAPADVFCSAAPKEMDALQKAGRIETAGRIDFAGNRLVLIAPMRSRLKSWSDLTSPRVRRIALSDPGSVPSGRYAQETLTKRGLWEVVKAKAVLGQNVRQTLTYVARGDADAGCVFKTDALHDAGKVRVVAEAMPGKDHPPILYPAAVVAHAPNAIAARSFVLFLQSAVARNILARYGFTPPFQSPATGKR